MQNELAKKAENELNARIKQFQKLLKNEEEKIKFYDGICGSEILVRLELFLPSANPDMFVDGIILYMNDTGKIVDAEYYFKELEEGAITRIADEDLKVVRELFQDEFSLEIE